MADTTVTAHWRNQEATTEFSFPHAQLAYRNRRQGSPRSNELKRRSAKVSFIENKIPDFQNIQAMLESCAEVNHWANRGPLYTRLAEQFSKHLNVKKDISVIPCANCGIGLEALARLLSLHQGRKLRWVAPSFCFSNIGRGYFSDVTFIDCDQNGALSLNELSQLDPADYDGVILVNPFGIIKNFDKHLNFARKQNKRLIIDNACGIDTQVPDWPWQSFSLHQTKPYGLGEGGLVLTPKWAAQELYSLIDYGSTPDQPESWLANGKLSDISCAFLLDRLEQSASWLPRYHEQMARITVLAEQCGLISLRQTMDGPPTTSLPFLSEHCIQSELIEMSKNICFSKYYRPQQPTPNAQNIWARIINIPSHPDMHALSDEKITSEFRNIQRAARMKDRQSSRRLARLCD